MKSWYEDVKAFHEAFGHPVCSRVCQLSKERVKARAKWKTEEVTEFIDADTVASQADACIDLIYFALGSLVEMGVDPQPLWDIVQNANMSKLWEDGKPRYKEDGKVMKPPTWADPGLLLREEVIRQAFLALPDTDKAMYVDGDFSARETCPKCGHEAHGKVCFNFQSDNDCNCTHDKDAVLEATKVRY